MPFGNSLPDHPLQKGLWVSGHQDKMNMATMVYSEGTTQGDHPSLHSGSGPCDRSHRERRSWLKRSSSLRNDAHTCLQESSMSPSHTQMNYSSKACFSVIHGWCHPTEFWSGNLNPKAQVPHSWTHRPHSKTCPFTARIKTVSNMGFITQFSLVAQSYVTLRPHDQHARLPDHHHLPEFGLKLMSIDAWCLSNHYTSVVSSHLLLFTVSVSGLLFKWVSSYIRWPLLELSL